MALGGPGFGEALFKNQIAQKQMEVQAMELDLKKGDLGFKLADLQERRQMARQQMIMKGLDDSVTRMAQFAETVASLGPNFKAGSALDKAIDTEKGIMAKFAEQLGLDANLGQAAAERARAGAMKRDMTTVGPGAALVDANNPQAGAALSVSAPTSSKTVEVPGETGTTRIQETTGGGQPTVQVGQPAAAQAAPSVQVPSAGAAPGAAAEPGGKALPQNAQDAITGGLASLKSLDVMEAALPQTGVVRGRVSNVETALGANKAAIDFKTARSNLMVQAQSIIKGIPSNFDITTFEKTLPDMTQPQSVNKSRIEYSRNIITQLIADTISYYKFTGARIPPDVLAQAKAQGVNVDSIKPWDGQGTPTKESERLAASGGKKPGIEGMSLNGLFKLDPTALTPEERKALDKRLKELGY